jgi:crotonobetainyl-CoA:carnitine CoA-transferase CaiB-like acyl-CoA transferase
MLEPVLNGIKVVEVAIYAFVPAAGAVLADWGADVVKVEDPTTGDPIRGLSAYGIAPGQGGVCVLWELFNRGKKSVGIDIRQPQGLELLMKLVDEADVFITNFIPSTCVRLGIDEENIRARNPRIIYGRGTGQGPIGPDANDGGFDALSYWGRSGAGLAAMSPEADFPVMLPGPAFGDVQSGMNLAGGIMAALYRRERTGQGATVDTSLLSSGLWATQASIAGAFVRDADNIVQLDRRRAPNPIANPYRSSDGESFVLGMLEADRYWPGLCDALDDSTLTADPRFQTAALRAEHCEACIEALGQIFANLTLDQIDERLAKQEGPWAVVSSPGSTLEDEQALVNEFIRYVECEGGAKLPMVPTPSKLDGPSPALTGAPEHGAQTDEVIAGLGLSMDQIMELKVAGVVL